MINYIIPTANEAATNYAPKEFLESKDWTEFSSSLLIETHRGDAIFTSSAVLIKRNILLTAAHSVHDIEKGFVHLSSTYKRDNMRVSFKKVIIHKGYDKSKSNYKDDLAIIILDNNLPRSFKPVSIARFAPVDVTIDRVGFGGREGINKRTWLNPKIKSFEEDTLVLEDFESVIGDSGGPLYFNGKLIGIHSTLEGTNKTYAVNICEYKNWIQENLPLKEV